MSKADISTTPIRSRRSASEEPDGQHSETIAQCIIYVQALATAYDAGFKIDCSGDSRYAGNGREISKARRAMTRLIALSPHAQPITALELYAKAGVLAAMYGLREDEGPDEIEAAYIRSFAGEVKDYLESQGVAP